MWRRLPTRTRSSPPPPPPPLRPPPPPPPHLPPRRPCPSARPAPRPAPPPAPRPPARTLPPPPCARGCAGGGSRGTRRTPTGAPVERRGTREWEGWRGRGLRGWRGQAGGRRGGGGRAGGGAAHLRRLARVVGDDLAVGLRRHLDGDALEELAQEGRVLLARDPRAPHVGELEEAVEDVVALHRLLPLAVAHPVLLARARRLLRRDVGDEHRAQLRVHLQVLRLTHAAVAVLVVDRPEGAERLLDARVVLERRAHRERLLGLPRRVALLPVRHAVVDAVVALARHLEREAQVLALLERRADVRLRGRDVPAEGELRAAHRDGRGRHEERDAGFCSCGAVRSCCAEQNSAQ